MIIFINKVYYNMIVNNLDEFLNSSLLERSVSDFYIKNKIDFAKADIFRNFTLFLNNTIQKTYVGDEYLDAEHKQNHFAWVWDKVCDDFTLLGFNFKDNSKLKEYMGALFEDLFYDIDNKEDEFNKDFFSNISVVIEGIFNYTILKTTESLYIFLEIYNIFNESLK